MYYKQDKQNTYNIVNVYYQIYDCYECCKSSLTRAALWQAAILNLRSCSSDIIEYRCMCINDCMKPIRIRKVVNFIILNQSRYWLLIIESTMYFKWYFNVHMVHFKKPTWRHLQRILCEFYMERKQLNIIRKCIIKCKTDGLW